MPLIVPDLCPERQCRQRPAWSPPLAARWSRRSRSAVHTTSVRWPVRLVATLRLTPARSSLRTAA